MSRLQLGQWVIVGGKAVKTHPADGRTEWERVAIEPVRAMYIGWRVVREGKWAYAPDRLGDDMIEPIIGEEYFRVDASLYVAEFVTHERRLPFKVFYKDIRDDLHDDDLEAARIPLYTLMRLTGNHYIRACDLQETRLFLEADNQRRYLLPIPERWQRLKGFCYSSTLKDAEGVPHEVILEHDMFELVEPEPEKTLA